MTAELLDELTIGLIALAPIAIFLLMVWLNSRRGQ